jgi:hypothetical protein
MRAIALVGLAILAAISVPAEAKAQEVEVLGGVHAGGPVRFSVSLGQFWFDTAGPGTRRGPVVLGELGLRGHRVSFGYLAEFGTQGTFASARLSWLRLRHGADAGLAGLELHALPAFLTGGRLGAFLPLATGQRRDVLLIGNISFGI